MEPQQQQNQQQPNDDSSGSGNKGSFLCRQSSTRWTPTTDQIRILKDLYYNNGVRSPSAEQIQRISARLRQYGKIEGKNVFYWFQNHKARERQKKRFTSDAPMQRAPTAHAAWKPDDPIHNKYLSSITPGHSSASPASAGVLTTIGQVANYGYGSVTMEKRFRDCSISPAGCSNGLGGSINHNLGWVSIDHYSTSYNFFDNRKSVLNETLEEEQEEEGEEEAPPEKETLPLFPMHGEDINATAFSRHNPADNYYSGWYLSSDDANASSRASLELSLNTYAGRSPDSL